MICPVDPAQGDPPDALRVRFAADPVSVPAVRRFVTDGLVSWDRGALVDTAQLCASELAGNAALHAASTFMEVVVQPHGDAVRLSVEDDGPVPAEVVAPRVTFDEPVDDVDVEDLPTTGRGLGIVAVLARDWGVEPTAGGKRVWADLGEEEPGRSGRVTAAGDPEPSDPATPAVPPGWVLVRLAGCPVRLSLRQDEHLDELVRELQLISSEHSQRSRVLSEQIQDVLISPAHARHTGRRQAERAAAAGLDEIDVEMAMPLEFSEMVRRLDQAVKAADELCEQAELLTLASPPELRSLRAWMTHELVAQIERGEDPVPWSDWVTRQDH